MDEKRFIKYISKKLPSSELNSILDTPLSNLKGSFKIKTKHLINICNDYLDSQFDSIIIEKIANDLIASDYFEWDSNKKSGERVSKIIIDWVNPDINFEIKNKNIGLWKEYLLTGIYKLKEYNLWDYHINDQRAICENNDLKWSPINPKLKIGLADNISNDPVNGLRHPSEKGTTGWYIWTGEYEERDDFYKPVCAEHLLDYRPEIIKYLGLPVGYRFQIDKNGYEDIWYDENLFNLE